MNITDLLYSQHTIGLYPEILQSPTIELSLIKVIAALSIIIQGLFLNYVAIPYFFSADFSSDHPYYFFITYFELWGTGLLVNIAYDLYIIFFEFFNPYEMDSLLFQMFIFSNPFWQITGIIQILYIYWNTETLNSIISVFIPSIVQLVPSLAFAYYLMDVNQ